MPKRSRAESSIRGTLKRTLKPVAKDLAHATANGDAAAVRQAGKQLTELLRTENFEDLIYSQALETAEATVRQMSRALGVSGLEIDLDTEVANAVSHFHNIAIDTAD